MKVSQRNILFILFSSALLISMASPIRALIAFALDTENTHASQIVLIPFISATLLYLNRKNIFQSVRYSVFPGLLLMMVGVGFLLMEKQTGANLVEGDRLAMTASFLVAVWLGGFLLFYGTSAFKTALFPLLFLIFCIPIPSPVLNATIDILRRGSTDMAYAILKLSGTPIHRDGFVFTMPDLVVEVAPQCSGIRSGISLFISSLLAGHLFLRTYWRRGLLIVIAVPILIFKNALRIGTLSFLAVHVNKQILASELHREGGIPFFILGLLLLYPVLTMLIRSERNGRKSPGVIRQAGDSIPLPG